MLKVLRSAALLRRLLVYSEIQSIRIVHECDHPSFRLIHTSARIFSKDGQKFNRDLPTTTVFDMETKNKKTFNQAIELFVRRDPRRKGHVEFIYAALKYMEEFGVDHDLESYRNIIEVLPKDKMIPTNVFQSEFMYFPKQQNCAVDVLDQMERKGVMPDHAMLRTLISQFGKNGIPVRKIRRMLYWMPKFAHKNPWPVPRPTPTDAFTLAKLAIERITSVDKLSAVSVLNTKDVQDSLDETWVISGQSPVQQRLLTNLPDNAAVHVEGPFLIWLRNLNVQYFIARADPTYELTPEIVDLDDVRNLKAPWMMDKQPSDLKPVRTVHEQDDGIILGVCATGTSSRDSLLSWVRLLEQHNNPRLATLPVLFRLSSSYKGDINKGDVAIHSH